MKCGFEEAQNHMLLLRIPQAFVASAPLWVLRIVHYCLTPVLEAVFQPRGPAAHFSDSEHRLLNEFEKCVAACAPARLLLPFAFQGRVAFGDWMDRLCELLSLVLPGALASGL